MSTESLVIAASRPLRVERATFVRHNKVRGDAVREDKVLPKDKHTLLAVAALLDCNLATAYGSFFGSLRNGREVHSVSVVLEHAH